MPLSGGDLVLGGSAGSSPSTTGVCAVCGASAGIGCGFAGADVVRAIGRRAGLRGGLGGGGGAGCGGASAVGAAVGPSAGCWLAPTGMLRRRRRVASTGW